MKAIQVRNVPEEIHRTLRARAAAANVSLSEYVLGELRRSAARPEIAEVLERAQSRSGRRLSGSEIAAAVRAGRTERD